MEGKLRGVFTAIITPFDTNGNVDEEAFQRLIDMQLEKGIDGIVPCGTTGESPTLSHQEHDRVIELTVKQVNGRVPVIAGTGSNSTQEAIRLSKHAQEVGADAVLQVNPYYNKPTQQGLYLHFKAVADAIDIPCILYNIKGRTAVNLETDTLVRLIDTCPNITGVKEASGDLQQMKDVIAGTPDSFSVLSGDDNISLNLVEAGGDGVVSVASNLIPDRMVKMIHMALDGDFDNAQTINEQLMELFQSLFLETNPIPIKAAMNMAGYCLETYRLPMCPLSTPEKRSTIEAILKRLEII